MGQLRKLAKKESKTSKKVLTEYPKDDKIYLARKKMSKKKTVQKREQISKKEMKIDRTLKSEQQVTRQFRVMIKSQTKLTIFQRRV